MSVRIGINYTAAIHQSAGIGRYTRELVNSLAGVPNDAFEPRYHLFVADAGQGFTSPLPGANFAWHPTRLTERWLNRLWFRLNLPLPIQRWTGPLDLFHAPDFVLPPVRRGTKTILTIHDLSFVHEPESVMPRMSTYLNQWVPQSVERADHVIAVSEATRQDLIELYQTPAQKISVLYHGVSPEFRPIQDTGKLATIRRKYKLGEQPFILSVGTMQPRKNYRRLVQAFAQIDGQVSLVIAGGKGWHYEEIYNEVTQQRLQERVHFLGFVPDDDLPALYNAATIFIYPSLYEGFGLPVLEAMACGTPVIASNQSSIPEVVGEAGILVNPRDVGAMAEAISQLLEDNELRERLPQEGLAQAAKFSWPEMGAKLLRLYQQILDCP